MEPQTYSLLAALSSAESISLLVTLLEEPASVEVAAKAAGLSSATASRRLEALGLVGLVTRPSPRAPYELTTPAETRRFLETLGDLSLSILDQRRQSEQRLQRRVKKSRFRVQSDTDEPAV